MQNLILFDSEARNHLLPLTATRPMAELRIGILKLREKWEKHLDATASYITQDYLQEKFPIRIEDDNLIVHGGLLPNKALVDRIKSIRSNEALVQDGELLAARISAQQIANLISDEALHELQGHEIEEESP
ncbi:MAG: putative sugar nucleotidyl transferase [Saprospiraceae bacterium]